MGRLSELQKMKRAIRAAYSHTTAQVNKVWNTRTLVRQTKEAIVDYTATLGDGPAKTWLQTEMAEVQKQVDLANSALNDCNWRLYHLTRTLGLEDSTGEE